MDPAYMDSSSPVPPPPPPPTSPSQDSKPPTQFIPASTNPPKKVTKKTALILASILVLLIGTVAGVGLVLTRQKPGVEATDCDDNQRWADITADWTGDNTARVVNSSSSCTYSIGLASYDFYSWSDQVLRDQDIKQVGPNQTVDFEVEIANCKTQLDLFFGTAAIPANHTFPDYANRGLIKWKHVGEINCSGTPTSTPSTPGTIPNCPAGSTLLFPQAGALQLNGTTGGNGRITAMEGPWQVENRDGRLLAASGWRMTVTFPQQTLLQNVLIFDNDPKSGESPWTINGTALPTTSPDNSWGPLFNLNSTSTQMVFFNGGDSPHFNVCLKTTTTPTNTPTPRPTNTPTPRPTNTPTPRPTNTPTPRPTNTPTPGPSATPGPSPTPTPTPIPSNTPTPGPTSTPTPGPSATPGPSPTPGPTATNTPNTPTPATQLAESGSTTQTWLTIIAGLGILGLGLLFAL